MLGFYGTNFELYHNHHLSLNEIENMPPYERQFYISLTNQWIKREQERIAQQNRKNGRM